MDTPTQKDIKELFESLSDKRMNADSKGRPFPQSTGGVIDALGWVLAYYEKPED